MFQAEVKQRQGSWCRRFETYEEALAWVRGRKDADAESTNPVTDTRIDDLSERKPLPLPLQWRTPFDETWKP